MRVGLMRAEFLVNGAHSLKDKRRVLRSLKDRLLSRFNVSVAEVDHQDLWQRTAIGLAFVTLDAPAADAKIQKLEAFMRAHPGASLVSCEKDIPSSMKGATRFTSG